MPATVHERWIRLSERGHYDGTSEPTSPPCASTLRTNARRVRTTQLLRRGIAAFTLRHDVRPRQDSNLRHRLRRPVLYPLSYEGKGWRL